jgi:hypothetical protein
MSEHGLEEMYKIEEMGEEIMCNGYEDYPYVFRGGFIAEGCHPYWRYYDHNFNYGYGADSAYEYKPNKVINVLMAEVL